VPSATVQGYYKDLITGLVNNGVWQCLDALYMFAAPEVSIAQVNMIRDDWYGAISAATPPTFVQNKGMIGNIYIGLDPSQAPTNVCNYSLNDASVGGWILNDWSVAGTYGIIGSTDQIIFFVLGYHVGLNGGNSYPPTVPENP
jgi:hypothetical protein